MTILDWSSREHWAGGWDLSWSHPTGQQGSRYHGRWVGGGDRRKDCHICKEKTFLVDDEGRPAHKVCTERRIDKGTHGA